MASPCATEDCLEADSPDCREADNDGAAFLAYANNDATHQGPPAGRSWFEAAYLEGERTGDEVVMAEAVLGLYGPWVHAHRTATAAATIEARLHRVRSLVDPNSDLGLRLWARAAAESDYRLGGHDEILAVLAEARRGEDPLARMEALSLAHHCLLDPGQADRRRAIANELIGEAARAGHSGHLAMGLVWLVADLFLDGDPHGQRRLGELRAVLAEQEHPAIEYVARSIEVMLAIRDGRLAEAEQLALECRERGVKAGDADADGWYGAQLVAIRWYQGRLVELLPLLKEMVHSPELSTVDNSFVAAYAVAAAQAGDEQTATGALAMLRGRSLDDLPRSSSWLITMYGVVEAARLLGNEKAAARAYELLLPYADKPMMASLAVACFGSVEHALGVAAMTTGDLDRAARHLREAVHRNQALGHWPAVAASRQRYAEVLACRPQDAPPAFLEPPVSDLPLSEVESPAGAIVLTRHGVRWRVDLGPLSALVDHSVGMLHLAVLTANPGVEIAAIDLAAGVAALGAARNHTVERATPAQPVLDRTAVAQYRHRLARLAEEIDDRAADGDDDGAARARAERDWVLAELSANAGLGGRSRTFADGRERARLAVGRAIRRAFGHIDDADAVIGAHLRSSVHTGAHCWYRPV